MSAPSFDSRPAATVLRWGLDDRVFPGASVEVGTSARVLWRGAVGALHYDAGAPAAGDGTVYDLASLTKVIATTTVAMRLVDTGALTLEDPVSRWVPSWTGAERLAVTVRDLLEHASGLPGWLPLFRTCRDRRTFVDAISATPLSCAPRSASTYSDLGFILLGHLLEEASGVSLERAYADAVSADWDDPMAAPRFRPPGAWFASIAPTQRADERGRLAPGDVDDTNAWALGGVAAHAGLFGTAAAVGSFARAVLRALAGAPDARWSLPGAAVLRTFARPSDVPGSSRALGWDTMRPTSSCGTHLSEAAIGHTGFTGTSLWIDPALDVYAVLLTNRVHPRAGDPAGILTIRRAFHDAVVEACLAAR